MKPSSSEAWDDAIDRLVALDVNYLDGGSAWDGRVSPYKTAAAVDLSALVRDLAGAPQARLRDALVALLFRHPEYGPEALAVATALPDRSETRTLIFASYLAAAALRRAWSFTLTIYLPDQPELDAGVAARLGVPSPEEDYGRPCLQAIAALLRRGQPFPFDYERGWHDVAEHILADLRMSARSSGVEAARYGA